MDEWENIRNRIKRLRPFAKFIEIIHSRDAIQVDLGLGDGFYLAALYDEQIDANMISIKQGRILVQNTYLSSFAYNLFSCWLYGYNYASGFRDLDKLMVYNFKKFLGEQLYRKADRARSRALLLETLLFEQSMMAKIVATRDRNPAFSAAATGAENLMSFALLMHELGHYFETYKPEMWDAIAMREDGAIGAFYEAAVLDLDPAIALEFKCDVYAIAACIQGYTDRTDYILRLRTIVFAYAMYAALYSAAATAAETAKLWAEEPPDEIDLLDISPFEHMEYGVKWAVDKPLIVRAGMVRTFCEKIAACQGESLYGEDGILPLPPSIVEDIVGYVGKAFDCDDDNIRNISNLVARSLHGHDAGMEYLFLRSKVFLSKRKLVIEK